MACVSTGGGASGLAGLPCLLAGLAGSPAAAVAAEAFAALQPLALAQPRALSSCWPGLREAILARLEAEPLAGEAAEIAGELAS